MGITAHSKTRSPPLACKPTLTDITADAAEEDRSIYVVSRGKCGLFTHITCRSGGGCGWVHWYLRPISCLFQLGFIAVKWRAEKRQNQYARRPAVKINKPLWTVWNLIWTPSIWGGSVSFRPRLNLQREHGYDLNSGTDVKAISRMGQEEEAFGKLISKE